MEQWKVTVLLVVIIPVVTAAVTSRSPRQELTLEASPEPRFLYFNATSGKLVMNANNLGIGLIGTGMSMGVLSTLYYLLFKPFFGKKRSDPEELDYNDDYQYQQERSMKSGFSWRDLNVLDWIAMFEEMYRKYDRFNPECHQRILCEFHETSRFHGVARRLDTVADYTGIFRNLGISLNEGLQELLDNLVDAIDKGRKGENSCGYYFGSCEFSLKDMSQKYLDPVNSNDVLESDQEFEDL